MSWILKINFTHMISRRSFFKGLSVSIILLLSLSITCCDSNWMANYKINRAVRHNHGRELNLSFNLGRILYDTIIPDCRITTKPLTIVSQVDKYECPKCTHSYFCFAEKFVSGFNSDSIMFIAIVFSDRINELLPLMDDVDTNKVKVFYDPDEIFMKENPSIIEIRKMWNVFLINGKRQIELQGDPLTQKGAKTLYQDYLHELVERNNWKTTD